MRNYILWLVLTMVIYNAKANPSSIKVLEKRGDLILGGLFPIHKKSNVTENACGTFDQQPGYQYMSAMLFAVDQINNRSDLLPNITIGTKIYDSCRSTTLGSDRARDFIKDTLFLKQAPLVGVVGPFTSDVSIATAQLLRVFGIPQVSYGSSSSILSNKEVYSNFFRTVPPDSFQAEAIADILAFFGWKYIVTISSKGNYGQQGIQDLQKALEKRNICIALSQHLPYLPTTNDYRNVMREIQKESYKNVNIIVSFTTQTDSSGLLKAALHVKASRFTWVGSSGWSNRMDVIAGKETIANGSITVNHLGGKVQDFEEYFSTVSSHTNSPWSKEFFKSVSKCNHGNIHSDLCNQLNNLTLKYIPPNMEMSPARVVINAVYAFAHALHDMQLATCVRKVGLCEEMRAKLRKVELVEYLRNTTFPDAVFGIDLKFNSNQEMNGNYSFMNFQQKLDGAWDYVHVGEWGGVNNGLGETAKKSFRVDVESVSWGSSPSSPPVSCCSRACNFPYISKPQTLHPKCCWDCIMCHDNQIILNGSCQSCRQGYRPTVNLSQCSRIPEVYPTFDDKVVIPCVVLTALGMISTLMTAVFFLKYNDHAVVKASGRELSGVILFGILFCYIAVFSVLLRPSIVTCTVNRYLGSVCYTLCYAPLFTKTNRIYRIFTNGKKSVSRPSMTSPMSQLLITFGLTTIQILISTLWTLSSPPKVTYHYHTLEITILECETKNFSFACNVSYNIFLMILCTAFAFKTRQFPRNFNEAKYIGIMMYLTCSIWIIFLPSLLNTENTHLKVYIVIWSYWIIGTITLTGLFVPKIYIVYHAQETNITLDKPESGSGFQSMNKLHNLSHQNQIHDVSDAERMVRAGRLYSGHVLNGEGDTAATSTNTDVSRCVTPSGSVNNVTC